MKKPFILLGGFSRTASSSLHQCFTDSKILTTGDFKECCYLNSVKDYQNNISHLDSYSYWYRISRCQHLLPTWNTLSHLKRDFFTTQTPSINQYLQYYLEVSKDYPTIPVVGDLTTTYSNLSPYLLKDLRKLFEPYFDVKVLLLLRDPVERLFSEFRYNQTNINQLLNTYQGLYQRTYDKYSNIFPTFCFDTAQLINHYHKKNELSEFLGIDIPDFDPVKINSTKNLEISNYHYKIAKRILKPDIDFYQSHL